MADEGVQEAAAAVTDDDRVIAANVRRLRAEAGMKQSELAEAMCAAGRTHWRQNTVSRVENGRQKLDLAEVESLSVLIGNVLEGTELSKKVGDVAKAATRSMTVHKLRTADEAMADALFHIRLLRVLHDTEYGPADAKAAYARDSQRGVESEPFGDDEPDLMY